jgi:hypothetical protein
MLTVVYLIAVRYILKLEVTSVRLLGNNYKKQEICCEEFDSRISMGQVVLASVQNRYTHEDYDHGMQ